MKGPKKKRSFIKKHWKVSRDLLEDRPLATTPPAPSPEDIPPPISAASPGMAILRARATEARDVLFDPERPSAVASGRGRAKNFEWQPDKPTLKKFKQLGFEEWLRRVKKEASVAATLNQLAEFVTWWTHTRKSAAVAPLELLVNVATVERRALEEYNTYLHKKEFRPASIRNRIDAVCYALTFIR